MCGTCLFALLRRRERPGVTPTPAVVVFLSPPRIAFLPSSRTESHLGPRPPFLPVHALWQCGAPSVCEMLFLRGFFGTHAARHVVVFLSDTISVGRPYASAMACLRCRAPSHASSIPTRGDEIPVLGAQMKVQKYRTISYCRCYWCINMYQAAFRLRAFAVNRSHFSGLHGFEHALVSAPSCAVAARSARGALDGGQFGHRAQSGPARSAVRGAYRRVFAVVGRPWLPGRQNDLACERRGGKGLAFRETSVLSGRPKAWR